MGVIHSFSSRAPLLHVLGFVFILDMMDGDGIKIPILEKWSGVGQGRGGDCSGHATGANPIAAGRIISKLDALSDQPQLL